MIRLIHILIVAMCSVITVYSSSEDSTHEVSTAGLRADAVFDTISGPLPKILKNNRHPYLVTGDIEVPADQMVTIEPGVVLLFRDFTGLHIQGKLIAAGTRNAPIIFTSEFDTLYNKSTDNIPNPFDWNGIYIHSGGIGTYLGYCKVCFSVYGIKSDTKYIKIDPAQFRDNGKSDFILEGKPIVTGKVPYSYVLDMKDAMIDGVPVKILRDPLAPKRNTVRYIGLAAFLGGAGCSVYYALQTKDVEGDVKAMSTLESTEGNKTSADWSSLRDKRNKYFRYSILSGAGALIGLMGFTWTFTF